MAIEGARESDQNNVARSSISVTRKRQKAGRNRQVVVAFTGAAPIVTWSGYSGQYPLATRFSRAALACLHLEEPAFACLEDELSRRRKPCIFIVHALAIEGDGVLADEAARFAL